MRSLRFGSGAPARFELPSARAASPSLAPRRATDPVFQHPLRADVANPTPAPPATSDYDEHHREARQFYRDVLVTLRDGDVPVLVGGAYAYARLTGIKRPTKDFDIFVRPEHVQRALAVLRRADFVAEATFPHWLAKAGRGLHFVDIIFSSGNGIARVDDEWFAHAVPGEVFALHVLLAPAEEMLWSKSFVME